MTSVPIEKTIVYKRNCLETMMKINDESALIDYLCKNYYISDQNVKQARILFASEQNTVKEYTNVIVNNIREEFPDAVIDFDYGIDVDGLFRELKEEFPDDKVFVHQVLEDEKFVRLLKKLDEKLHTRKRGILKTSENTLENGRERFTRTEIITLYYCYFLNVLDDLISCYGIVDLPGMYSEFCDGDGYRKGINSYLVKCRYQKINEKNIYDMFIIFALFLEQIR